MPVAAPRSVDFPDCGGPMMAAFTVNSFQLRAIVGWVWGWSTGLEELKTGDWVRIYSSGNDLDGSLPLSDKESRMKIEVG